MTDKNQRGSAAGCTREMTEDEIEALAPGEFGSDLDFAGNAEEDEIASIRAFLVEAACLLGCEADEPGALESMTVELSAMRDRDVDGAIEIERLTAEIAREILRQEYALSIAGSVHGAELASLRAEVERLTAELSALRGRDGILVSEWQVQEAAILRAEAERQVQETANLRAEVERITAEIASLRAGLSALLFDGGAR